MPSNYLWWNYAYLSQISLFLVYLYKYFCLVQIWLEIGKFRKEYGLVRRCSVSDCTDTILTIPYLGNLQERDEFENCAAYRIPDIKMLLSMQYVLILIIIND